MAFGHRVNDEIFIILSNSTEFNWKGTDWGEDMNFFWTGNGEPVVYSDWRNGILLNQNVSTREHCMNSIVRWYFRRAESSAWRPRKMHSIYCGTHSKWLFRMDRWKLWLENLFCLWNIKKLMNAVQNEIEIEMLWNIKYQHLFSVCHYYRSLCCVCVPFAVFSWIPVSGSLPPNWMKSSEYFCFFFSLTFRIWIGERKKDEW